MEHTDPTPETTIRLAAQQLARSPRGRQALAALLDMLGTGALGLDARNQNALGTLLQMAWTSHPSSTRDIIRDTLAPPQPPRADDDADSAACPECHSAPCRCGERDLTTQTLIV